jgi:xanthine dehydrogenase accessory factor
MKDESFWKFIFDNVSKGIPVVLIVVGSCEKGSPGKTGFKIAFNKEKEFVGTIGGGVMENRLMDQYSELLKEGKSFRDIRFLVHSKETQRGEASGLVCAGSQTICAISLDKNDYPTIGLILKALQHSLGKFQCGSDGLSFNEKENSDYIAFRQLSKQEWMYEENLGPEFTMFIVGGGHVGFALSRIMATLDMNVVVYDERSEMKLLTGNKFAHKKIAASYNELGKHISLPKKTFAAIVTSNMNTDAVALRQLIPLHLPYIGLMGTAAKITRILNSLSEEEKRMAGEIHAPIGVSINSRTAEEIAISIAAEVIKIKNHSID